MVVKTQEDEGLFSNLVETLDNLRKFKMKLNLEKCTFGVPSGKLLGYMVSHRGIDPNPEKVSAITKMKPLESLHDIQKLMGCMAALSSSSHDSTSGDSLSLSSSRNRTSSSGLRRHKRPSKT
jgi:hypothetical protein